MMHLVSRNKAVYSPKSEQKKSKDEPTPPVSPVYEEILPQVKIELNTNQAYGQIGLSNTVISLESLQMPTI